MNLQESCYLEMYNHVYKDYQRKEEAHRKIRIWWAFVSSPKNVTIIRLKNDDSLIYSLKSIIFITDFQLVITGLDVERELSITFNNMKQLNWYILKLILRAKRAYKLQIVESYGPFENRLCFQLLE